MPARELAHRAPDALVFEAAVAHRALLRDGEGPMGGRDDRGAVRRDHSGLRRAARFEEFGRHQEIHVSRGRQQGHDVCCGDGAFVRGGGAVRPDRVAARAGRAVGTNLQVVGGGSGALCDTGHRCCLHPPAVRRGGIHEPVREHASAFTPQRRDQNRPGSVGRLLRTVLRIRDAAGNQGGNDGDTVCRVGRSGRRSGARASYGVWNRRSHECAASAPRKRADHPAPHAVKESIPGGRVVHHFGSEERRAQHRRVRDLAAQAAPHAVVVDVCDRIGAQRGSELSLTVRLGQPERRMQE